VNVTPLVIVTQKVVILNWFQDPARLGALSREILKPVQDDDSISHHCAARNGI
jgi:hypothetical protein